MKRNCPWLRLQVPAALYEPAWHSPNAGGTVFVKGSLRKFSDFLQENSACRIEGQDRSPISKAASKRILELDVALSLKLLPLAIRMGPCRISTHGTRHLNTVDPKL